MSSTFNQSTDYSAPQTTYFAGVIHPWDDYIIIEVGDYEYVAVVGSCSDSSSGSVVFDSADVYTVTRNGGSGYSYVYSVDVSSDTDITVNYSNPYYAYGNVNNELSTINLTSSNNITSYMVCWSVLMSLAVYLFFGVIKKICRRIFKCAR